MIPIFIAVNEERVLDAQKWLRDNKIKHHPTLKVDGGHIYCLLTEEDAMAFKLAWS